VEEYGQHVLLPLLVVVFKHLNPWCVEGPPPPTPINDDSSWGVAVSIKEDDLSLVKFELSCIVAYMWMITM
jgi:hypothetical protein